MPAGGANGGLTFEASLPYRSARRRLVDVAAHGLRPSPGNVDLLTRRTAYAHALVFVIARGAYVLMAGMAPMEMAQGLTLGALESRLVFALPLGAAAVEAFVDNIASTFDCPAQAAGSAAQKPAQGASATGQTAQTLAFMVCARLYERALEAVVAVIAVKRELEAGLGRVIGIVPGVALHRLPLPCSTGSAESRTGSQLDSA